MYLGIDIGTSAVKAILVDDHQEVVAQASIPLSVSRPRELWSEQNPEDWWLATCAAIGKIRTTHKTELQGTAAIGLSGQMHGATLLEENNIVLRPAILWNDGRSGSQCRELQEKVPDLPQITGNLAMPGFTAPKLLWIKQNEPEIFSRVARVLLPKDYVRFRLTGEFVSDMSDSAGTLWMDVENRCWSGKMLEATDLAEKHMPKLVEGSDVSGELRKDIADTLGLPASIPVAGGGGDNACGAVGMGTVEPGRAFLSLGTSGVFFVANGGYSPNPQRAVHAFCHALPDRWHQMSVILSASSCLTWAAGLTGAADEASLLSEVESINGDPATEIFLPYLSGERTPHNNPHARGVFYGINHDTNRPRLARAVLDGVAFAFADGQQALLETGVPVEQVSVIGGGSRSLFWGRILASVLDRPLTYHDGGELGPAFGAARLARLSVSGEPVGEVCTLQPVTHVVEPNRNLVAKYQSQLLSYRSLYQDLKAGFVATQS